MLSPISLSTNDGTSSGRLRTANNHPTDGSQTTASQTGNVQEAIRPNQITVRPSGQATQTRNKATQLHARATQPNAINATMNGGLKNAEGLDEAIRQNKEQSLAFQLMRAIARVNAENQQEPGQKSTNPPSPVNSRLASQRLQELNSQSSNEVININDSSQFNASNSFSLSYSSSTQTSLTISLIAQSGSDVRLISLEESRSISLELASEKQQVDPLIINFSNSEFSFDLNNTVNFDLNADGAKDNFLSPGEGNYFLAFDRNQNGIIDDGSELFGDLNGSKDGFDALSDFDQNADGLIDINDPIFNQLVALSFNTDGSQNLLSLSQSDVQAISLSATTNNKVYEDGNQLTAESKITSNNGEQGKIGDFLITVR